MKKAIFINVPFYHYIYNDESITTVHNEKNHQLVLNCFKKIKEEINNTDSEIIGWFYNRLKYVIITTAVSGYFSVSNKETYKLQKKKFENYMSDELLQEALLSDNDYGISRIRKITLFLIKHKLFLCVKVISVIRTFQRKKL